MAAATIEIAPDTDVPRLQPITTESVSRRTKDGRVLTYTLRVIQQPDHARACGSGQKAHADRRPVDPPPVVQLSVHDGHEDVTFTHEANFFLFATLESADPSSPSTVPVLTGVNVSGMAYLDRPSPAGYFLFPDLSVRHEGSYKLKFSLYEEMKRASDADADDVAVSLPHAYRTEGDMVGPLATRDYMHWRLEVSSTEFTVYSAKKFPGLENSTALSRTIAEQGCRIRIRRDVRMRRRDFKGKKEDGAESSRRSSVTVGTQSIASSTLTTPTTTEYPRSVPIQAAPAMESAPPIPQTLYPSSYGKPALPHIMQQTYQPMPQQRIETAEMEVDPNPTDYGTVLPPLTQFAPRSKTGHPAAREYLAARHEMLAKRMQRFIQEDSLPDAPALDVPPAPEPVPTTYRPTLLPAPVEPSARTLKRSFDDSFGADSFEGALTFKRASGVTAEKRAAV